jgi:hypothetical protein
MLVKVCQRLYYFSRSPCHHEMWLGWMDGWMDGEDMEPTNDRQDVIPIVCQVPDGDTFHHHHHHYREIIMTIRPTTFKETTHRLRHTSSKQVVACVTRGIESQVHFAPKGRWGCFEYSNKYTLWQKPQGAKCVQRLDDSRRVQFTSRFAVRCVLHRCKSREIHC